MLYKTFLNILGSNIILFCLENNSVLNGDLLNFFILKRS